MHCTDQTLVLLTLFRMYWKRMNQRDIFININNKMQDPREWVMYLFNNAWSV